MPTISLDEARARFGEIVHAPTRTFREFDDPDSGGIWRAVVVEGETIGFLLYQLHRVTKKPSWRKR